MASRAHLRTTASTAFLVFALAACSGGTSGSMTGGSTDSSMAEDSMADAGMGASEVAGAVASPEGGAATPAEAVDGFVAAEIAGDAEASFVLLSAADRAAYGSAMEWAAAKADLPRYVRSTPASGEHPETEVVLEPRLDPVVGFVPARADVRWGVVHEEDGWFVDLATTDVVPVIPSDAGAAPAAVEWVSARQACDDTGPEVEGGIVGTISITTALCGLEGAAVAGSPRSLRDLPNRADVLSAFGDGADAWARVVPVTGPVPLDVVVGPLGDDWVVVSVLAR